MRFRWSDLIPGRKFARILAAHTPLVLDEAMRLARRINYDPAIASSLVHQDEVPFEPRETFFQRCLSNLTPKT